MSEGYEGNTGKSQRFDHAIVRLLVVESDVEFVMECRQREVVAPIARNEVVGGFRLEPCGGEALDLQHRWTGAVTPARCRRVDAVSLNRVDARADHIGMPL